MTGRQLADVPEKRAASGSPTSKQVFDDALVVQVVLVSRHEQFSDRRRESCLLPGEPEEHRSNAELVACDEQRSIPSVPDQDGEIAAQPSDKIIAPAPVRLDQERSKGGRRRLKRRLQRPVIVDARISDDVRIVASLTVRRVV